MSKELQVINTQVRPILPHDIESAWRMSQYIAASGLAPKNIQTKEAIFTAIQMGAEVGLSPMQALQNIAVVNGRPTIWGDAQLGLVRGSGLLEKFKEWLEGEGDTMKCFCLVKRKGEDEIIGEFSVDDAKKAQLWSKPGPWVQYPKRMLKMRARGFALRDGFSDILKGIYSQEESVGNRDFEDVTPTTTHQTTSINEILQKTEAIAIEQESYDKQTGEIIDDTPTESIPLADRVNSMIADIAMDREQFGKDDYQNVTESEVFKALWQEIKASGDKVLLGKISEAMGAK